MYLDVAIVATISFFNLLLAVIIFLRNPKGAINIIFAFLAIAVSAWTACNTLADVSSVNNLIFTRCTFAAAACVAFGIYLLSQSVSRNPKYWTAATKFQLSFALLIVVLSFTPLLVSGVTKTDHGVDLGVGYGYLLYIVFILQAFVFVIVNFIRNYKVADHITRNQILLLSAGIIIYALLAIGSNLILPLMYDSWSSSRYGPIFSLIFIGFVAYAIVKHKLFDIRSYVLRATAYLFSVVLVSVLYIMPILLILAWLLPKTGWPASSFVLILIVMSIAGAGYGSIHKSFDRITNRLFFRDTYDSALLLGQINRLLVTAIDLRKILPELAKLIVETLKIDMCVIVVRQTALADQRISGVGKLAITPKDLEAVHKQFSQQKSQLILVDEMGEQHKPLQRILQKANVAVVARLINEAANTDSIGYMMLGYKKSGRPYLTQDKTTLASIADVLAIAIQNALHFEEIQKFNVTLQQQVEDATRKLRNTNAKLVALDETKDDFISMASHQLRTPLTSVKGYLSMVLDGDAGKLTPDQRKMLNQAFTSSQRMVYLISDLLNVSRLKTGKFVIDRTDVDLAHLIDQEIGQLRETAAGRGLELNYDKPKNFPRLMLDETKTRQVLMNFIDNAIHYTPSGGHVTVELRETPHNIELRVRDDGIGVPKAEQHHLFTKFYRAGNARRQRPDGTGLGLFMAKKVIIAQGGAVVFESRERKGSVFGFTMPKHKFLAPS